jgi:hypothetical protein
MAKNTKVQGSKTKVEQPLANCGVMLIAEERARQIDSEGWSYAHDDQHDQRELARAALAYVAQYVHRAWVFTNELGMPGIRDNPEAHYRKEEAPDSWPWDEKYWKPKSPLHDLVKAGALIAAEIDRLQRSAEKEGAGK